MSKATGEPELFEMLRCPQTHQRLLPVTTKWLDRLNKRIAKGEVLRESGESVTETLEDGLLTEDERFLYPVREGLANMFVADRIILKK